MPQATAIEDAAKNLVGVNNLLQQTKKDSTVIAQQWDLTNKLFSGLATYAGGWLFLQTKLGREIHGATHQLKEVATFPFGKNLDKMRNDMSWLREEAAQFYREHVKAAGDQSALAKEQLESFRARFNYMNDILAREKARNEAVKKYDEFHRHINWQLGAYVVLLAKASDLWFTMNRYMAEARAAEDGRARYFSQSLRAAMQLGASVSETATVMSALVERGRDLTNNLEKDVKLALQLHRAYGMSGTDAAEFVASFGRLSVDTQRVADGIARVVAKTALSADEAARLSSNLARAFALMRPGQAGGLGEVSEYLMEIEGQMKSLTGTAGDLTAFYNRAATTIEGMGLAEQLGIDPATLGKNKAAAERFTVGLANMVENLTRGLDDRGRVLVLQQLAQQLGTDSMMLANLTRAIKTNNKQSAEELNLRKQFDNQMRNTGQSLRQLYNAGGLLLGQALTPLVKILVSVVDAVTKFVQSIITFKPVLVALQAIAVVAFPYFLVKAIQASIAAVALGRALMNLAKHAATAATATKAQAVANRRASVANRRAPMAQGELFPDTFGGGRGRGVSRIPRGRAQAGVPIRRVGTARGGAGVLRALTGIKDAILGSRAVGSRTLLALVKPALILLKGIGAAIGIAGGALLIVGGLIVGGLAYALKRGFDSVHKAKDQEIKAQLNLFKQQDDYKKAIHKQIHELAQQGDVAGIKEFEKRVREHAKSPETRREAELALGSSWKVVEDAVNQRFLKDVREQHGVAMTEDELSYYDRMLEISEQLRVTADEQLNEMRKKAKEDEKSVEDGKKRAERDRLLKIQEAMGNASKGRWK